MIRLVLGIVVFLLVTPVTTRANEIQVVLSDNIAPYRQAADGIRDFLTGLHVSRKTIRPYLSDRLVPETEPLHLDQVRLAIQQNNPQVVIAVGSKALGLVKAATGLPVVYVMTPNPASVLSDTSNVTGILMQSVPGDVLKAIATAFPNRKRLGILYDPAHSSELIRQASEPSDHPFTLVPIPVHSSAEAVSDLFRARNTLDVLWLIPDRTVVTSRNVEAFVRFSFDNRVPLIAFAEKYLKQGATMSVAATPFNMGREAADLAVAILQGAKAADLPPRSTRQIEVELNKTVMDKINFRARPEGGTK